MMSLLVAEQDFIDTGAGGDDGTMSLVLERPTDTDTDELADAARRYRELGEQWPDRKVELIDDRIVVREVPTADHAKIIFRLRWSHPAARMTIMRPNRADVPWARFRSTSSSTLSPTRSDCCPAPAKTVTTMRSRSSSANRSTFPPLGTSPSTRHG